MAATEAGQMPSNAGVHLDSFLTSLYTQLALPASVGGKETLSTRTACTMQKFTVQV